MWVPVAEEYRLSRLVRLILYRKFFAPSADLLTLSFVFPPLIILDNHSGSPLGHLLLKTCSRHTHPLSPLAPNTSGATTLLFDARAVRVRRAALVRPRQRLAVSPSPSSSSWSGERRSRTRTTSSSAMTMVGSDDGGAELPKWAADAEDALAAVVGTERSMERGERMIGQRWKGAVGR